MKSRSFSLVTTSKDASMQAKFYEKPVWVYQIGPECYGFRFAPLPETEQGVLIARYDASGKPI